MAASALALAAASGTSSATLVGAVSALSSQTLVGTLFGAAGAGVAGYKMANRLKGVEEFELESSNLGHLAVCVCVSGWMVTDSCDYQRSFGILPSNMPLKERLERYFMQHDPARLAQVSELCRVNAEDEPKLYKTLISQTGFDPEKEEHLLPNKEPITVSQNLWSLFSELDKQNYSYDLAEKPLDLVDLEKDVATTSQPLSPNTAIDSPLNDISLDEDIEIREEETSPGSTSLWSIREVPLHVTHDMQLLRWETNLQLKLGDSVPKLFRSTGSQVVQNMILPASLAAVNQAVALPLTIIKLTNYIDGVWTLMEKRADIAGKALAMSILEGACTRRRPVSLIGFSMGARLIFSCLQHLSTLLEKDSSVADIIEDVVLLGCPVTTERAIWEGIRPVINGRLINGFSRSDLVLSFLYRIEGLRIFVAGVSQVDSPFVENVDLSSIIGYHGDYALKMKQLLQLLNIDRI